MLVASESSSAGADRRDAIASTSMRATREGFAVVAPVGSRYEKRTPAGVYGPLTGCTVLQGVARDATQSR